ncbi:MAG: hypothetical protein GF403_00515 [Candidatus Coatesbacteria bacterium]|nr:hypothetical protein [Candidatus Coatesbacteria bacterium]
MLRRFSLLMVPLLLLSCGEDASQGEENPVENDAQPQSPTELPAPPELAAAVEDFLNDVSLGYGVEVREAFAPEAPADEVDELTEALDSGVLLVTSVQQLGPVRLFESDAGPRGSVELEYQALRDGEETGGRGGLELVETPEGWRVLEHPFVE